MIPSGARVWIAMGHTDMRRGMQSLAAQVQQHFFKDPFAGDLWVFRGRSGSLVKIIWHDGIGMSLYAKRLEKGRFVWPSAKDGVVSLTTAQLAWTPVPEATGYRVQRSVSGGAWTTLGATTTPEFTDPTVAADRIYRYRVTALNEHGEAPASASALINTALPPAPTVIGFTADRVTLRLAGVANFTTSSGYETLTVQRATNPDGTLTYSFVESLNATYPYYLIRLGGGLLVLSGMLLMGWNVVKTIGAGRMPVNAARA